MASGRTHSTVALIAAGVVPLAVHIFYPNWPLDSIVKGLLIGWLITPDEDVDGTTFEEERLEHIPLIGPFLGWIWCVVWFPYARAIPHRHPLSHWPPFGTLGRFLYLYLWAWVIASCIGINLPLKVDWWLIGAWMLQDTLHLIADYV